MGDRSVPSRGSVIVLVLAATAVLAGCVEPVYISRVCYGGTAPATVALVDFAFEPYELCVDEGKTVTWTHEGFMNHTVTAVDGTFDSGDLAPGETFEVTFDELGEVDYYCRYHSTVEDDGSRSGMVGVVSVEDLRGTPGGDDGNASASDGAARVRPLNG